MDCEIELIIHGRMSMLHRFQAHIEGSNKSSGIEMDPSMNSSFILEPRAQHMERVYEW